MQTADDILRHSCGHAPCAIGRSGFPCAYCAAMAADAEAGLPAFPDDIGTPSRVIAAASDARRAALESGASPSFRELLDVRLWLAADLSSRLAKRPSAT